MINENYFMLSYKLAITTVGNPLWFPSMSSTSELDLSHPQLRPLKLNKMYMGYLSNFSVL